MGSGRNRGNGLFFHSYEDLRVAVGTLVHPRGRTGRCGVVVRKRRRFSGSWIIAEARRHPIWGNEPIESRGDFFGSEFDRRREAEIRITIMIKRGKTERAASTEAARSLEILQPMMNRTKESTKSKSIYSPTRSLSLGDSPNSVRSNYYPGG
jgi:hypothetical protein